MHIGASEILAGMGAVLMFFVGIAFFSLRAALARLERDDEKIIVRMGVEDEKMVKRFESTTKDLYERVNQLDRKLSGLCAEHNRIVSQGHR